MLTVSTIVQKSVIDGYGCYAGEDILGGDTVWFLDHEVDTTLDRLHKGWWKWEHAYKSHVQDSLWILPRDNAAWINFSDDPNLREGRLFNGEPTLVAARPIAKDEELTVGPETDADASEKLKRRKE